ncbi:hypothetical protein [Acinetobacter dispersus]|uniref:Uncharacterized protein n=1 Tax=Acinetobacter dispersus TaxID=70348 RepID=N9MPU7_9GAMM|nr:hypothetical protein [Acinetobacter dispersus]ENW92796.1 hypothetical protein F904_02739 [Acinetobacter dispersus]
MINIVKPKKLKIDWLGNCPKCERSIVTVSTVKGSLEKLFDGDKVECWCGQTGEIDTGDNNAWVEWNVVVLSNKDNHDAYYREKYPDYWNRLPACNHQAWTHYEVSLNSWLVALHRNQEKLEGCVVVPKDQTEDWYLDPDEHMWWEADGIDGTLCDLNIGEVAAIEHKEYLITASDTLYAAIVWDDENEDTGTWEFFKTEEEAEKAATHCKSMVEAARSGNE